MARLDFAGAPTTLEPDQQADAECERNTGKQIFEVHRHSPWDTMKNIVTM